MDFDAADLAQFYDADMPGRVWVAPASGAAFAALIRSQDQEMFDAARIGTHVLRYLEGTTLARGAALTIAEGTSAGAYVVAAPPRRVNADEFEVDLVLA